jgi:hypothetical protein
VHAAAATTALVQAVRMPPVRLAMRLVPVLAATAPARHLPQRSL